MAACNWVVCNVECRFVAITGANIPVTCHMCLSLWLGWGLGTRWCVQQVPGHRLGCGGQEMGCEVVALVVPGGRHAPLDWNSYCVHELADNTLLFLFVFFTNNCCFSIKVCHVLLCMSRNTGQINPAGFQSLKYVYYTHVIMTIKWILTLTLTLNILKYISSSFMGVIRITSFTGNGWWVYRHEPQSVITKTNWSTHTHIYI